MNFGNARMIKMDFVICRSSDVQPFSAWRKTQGNLARTVGQGNTRGNRNFIFFLWRTLPRFLQLVFQILLLQLFFKFSKGGFDGNTGREYVDIGFDRDRPKGSIAVIVNMIDGRSEDFRFQPLGYFGRRLRMLAPFNLEFQMMRRDAVATTFLANPLVNPRVHALD